MSSRKGPPKHQNKSAWKANAGVKKNDKELGGKLHPYPQVTGVCPRCKAQIEWRRKYGKYKALSEPSKCNRCSKRAIRQAYHALCVACAQERNVCAKCCQPSGVIVGRDVEQEKEQQQILEHALRNLRERDKRTLLRAMNNGTYKEDRRQEVCVTRNKENVEDDDADESEDLLSDSEGSELSEGFDTEEQQSSSIKAKKNQPFRTTENKEIEEDNKDESEESDTYSEEFGLIDSDTNIAGKEHGSTFEVSLIEKISLK